MAALPKYAGVRAKGQKTEISFQVLGRRYYETLELRPNKTNFETARKIRQDRIDEVKRGPAAGSASFGDLATLYLDSLDVSLATSQSYLNLLNRYWMPTLADRDINDIRYSDLLRLTSQIVWPSGKTRKNAIIPLRGVFELAVADDLRPDNPAARLRQKKHQKPDIDPITTEEWSMVAKHLPEPALTYFSLAWETGMRHPGEIVALIWDDFLGDRLIVDKAVSRGQLKGTKNSQTREVLLTTKAQSLLRNHSGRFKGGPIFPNTEGNRMRDGDLMNGFWREACKKAKVRHRRAYNLRHGWASRALTAGLKPSFVAQQLGHSLQMTLTVYGKYIASESDRNQIDLMEKNEKCGHSVVTIP
mgnify:CR=1 FL=1